MSSISSSIASIIDTLKQRNADPKEDPGKAFKRLSLDGKAHQPYIDVVHFGATDIAIVAKTIDDERDHLEQASARAKEAVDALDKAEELLGKAGELADANAKGAGRGRRRSNQKQIDDLIRQLGEAFETASEAAPELFSGRTTLTAGDASVVVPGLSRDTLGKLVLNGRVVSVKDIRTHGALDTAGRRTGVLGAVKAIKSATETVKDLRTRLKEFTSDKIRPRLGDVATAVSGLYTDVADYLGSSELALKTAKELRGITLSSTTAALAVGAEGWDRERILDLLT